MVSEFDDLINELKRYYGDRLIGFIVYEIPDLNILGILIVFSVRSTIMLEDSLELMQFVKHIYPNAKSVSVISLGELKEKIKSEKDKIAEFLNNIVYIYDETGEIKRLLE